MAFDIKEACLTARAIITDRSPASVGIALPIIQALVPTALDLWRVKLTTDLEAREVLKTVVSLNLVSGVADLTNYVNGTQKQISLKDLRNSTIYTTISGVRTPFTWVNSQQQLNQNRQLSSDAPACFLDGYVLRTKGTDGSLTGLDSASIEFTGIDYPITVEGIPPSLQESFVLTLADLVMSRGGGSN